MKKNSLIIILAITLILSMGGLFVFSRLDKNLGSNSKQPQPSPKITQPKDEPSDAPAPSETEDPELEAMPTVSEETDLETIEKELDQTQILEEDF
jgi:hypothetical protein